MADTTAQPPTPICPRCGYDQSGVIATWQSACPLRGLCSECGLDFDWRLVLGSQALGPHWSVEHGERLSLRRFTGAVRRGARQGSMWREFELAYPIRPRRLALLLGYSLLFNHLVLGAILAAGSAIMRGTRGWSMLEPLSPGIWLWPYDKLVEIDFGGGYFVDVDPGPTAILTYFPLFIPPVLMLIFVETMSRVGVRKPHLLRGLAYMAPGLAPASVGLTAGWVLLQAMGMTVLSGARLVLVPLLIVYFLAWPTIQTLRWRAFIKDYLRLPRASWITASIFIILLLSIVLFAVLVFIMFAD